MRIGDYVRAKVNDYERNTIIITKLNYFAYNNLISVEDSELLLGNESIIKSSSNIIDLIEVGDYVNGVLINDIDIYPSGKVVGYRNSEDLWEYDFKNNEIKSIVTKEQFKDIQYKVNGGDEEDVK